MGRYVTPCGAGRFRGSAMRRRRSGVSLVEILLGLLIVTIASIATLRYFASGFGSMGKQGRRRAALERARERLEQLMATDMNQSVLQPPDNSQYWLTCSGTPCSWTRSSSRATHTVAVNDLPNQTIETTIQRAHDPSAGTSASTLDTTVFGVEVWFTPNNSIHDNFNRVYVRTLRTP